MTWRRRKYTELSFDEAIANIEASQTKIERSINYRVFYFVFGAVILFSVIGIGRVFELGILKNSFYAARAEGNFNRNIPIVAPRGIIVDRYGKPLVENRLIFSAFLRVSDMVKNNEKDGILKALNDILGIRPQEIITKLDKANLENSNEIKIAEDLTREESIKINGVNLISLYIQNDYKRDYLSPAFSHVVGYVGLPTKDDLATNSNMSLIDVVGRAGLEAYYNDYLKGTNGVRVVYKNSRSQTENLTDGAIIQNSSQIIREPKIGKTLKTTIDSDLQKVFYESLVRNTTLRGQKAAVGIALNPQNGEILAMISLPSYDPNNINKYLADPNKPLFNRAVSGLYNPGSTIKPLHALAGLHEGIMSPSLEIYSRGYIEVPNQFNPNSPTRFVDWKPHGWVNVSSALAKSSNIYFYGTIGGLPDTEASQILNGASSIKGLGISRLKEYWETFGFNKKTGIDIKGEVIGLLPDPEEKEARTGNAWRLGDTYNVSIGQGDLAINPMQLANYISAIANKGIIYKPHFKKDQEPEVLLDLSRFEKEFKIVEIGMKDAVYKPYGTANRIADIPFKLAAKTGTAQTNNNTRANALIVAYGPTDTPNGPEIAILVLIENAKEGSLNAVPIARDVLQWYYSHRLTVND